MINSNSWVMSNSTHPPHSPPPPPPRTDGCERTLYHSVTYGKIEIRLEHNVTNKTIEITSYHGITNQPVNSWTHCGDLFYGGKPSWFVNFALRIDPEVEGEWLIVAYPPGNILDVYTLSGRRVTSIPCAQLDRNSKNLVFYDPANPGKIRLEVGAKANKVYTVDLLTYTVSSIQ